MQNMVSASATPSTRSIENSAVVRELLGGSRPVFQRKLALAIPTLCEADNIPVLLDRVRAVLDSLKIEYEILIVDDDSCDGTAKVVAAIAQEDPRIRLLVRKGQRGLSGAILHGWGHPDAAVAGGTARAFQSH